MKVLYVGTYTGPKPVHNEIGGGHGIHIFRLNYEIGQKPELSPISTIKCDQPSYFCISKNQKWIYAVAEADRPHENALNVFKINDLAQGKAEFVGKYDAKGRAACFVSQLDDLVFLANYTSGSAVAFKQDKQAGTLSQVWYKQFLGSTRADPARQEGPHAHCAVHHGENRHLYIADLGADKVYIFEIMKENLKPFDKQPSVRFPEGSGPRHITIHHTANFVFVACELSCTVIPFKINKDKTWTQIQEPIACKAENPEEFFANPDEVFNCVADIRLTPDGNFLYVSMRGKVNNLAMFSVDQRDGELHLLGYVSCRGKCPRNFCIDPTGSLLLCANQDSDNIVAFEIDKQTGLLTYLGAEFECPAPVCMEIVEV